MSRAERKAMITRDASERCQCRLLSIGRSSFYYAPRGESPSSLADASDRRVVHEVPVLRQPPDGELRRDGVCVGRHVRRLMRLIGLEALSGAEPACASHGPAQRDGRPAQLRIWCADMTYIPVQRGFLYLVAMDWATRRLILAAVEHHGRWILRRGPTRWPATGRRYSIRIRAEFTSLDFTGVLKNASSISMDGRGRCMRAPVAVSQV